MTKLIAQLHDSHQRITIPYFYYDVDEVEVDVTLRHRKLKFDNEQLIAHSGIKMVFKDKEFDTLTQIGLRPTIEVT
jgi:hypothetical protein